MTAKSVMPGRLVTAAVAVVLAAGCGADTYTPTGYRREPPPAVGDFELPDLSNEGAAFRLAAEPGNLLVVYFGYTNCPDFCPTTLSDLRIAQRRLADEHPDQPDRIAEAMITVDPDRDAPVLADYLGSFFPNGHALAAADPSDLAAVAAPFGVTYTITPAAESASGQIEVGHTTSLYALDDRGQVVLTWPFGTSLDDLTADLSHLLDQAAAPLEDT